MKEVPIIFSAEMIQAILKRHKTETRRIVRPQPVLFEYPNLWLWQAKPWRAKHRGHRHVCDAQALPDVLVQEGPYQAGDHLWVRETWGGIFLSSQSGHYLQWKNVPKSDRTQERCEYLLYRATDDDPDYEGCWAPSIHMPRWASRLTLEVLGVRAERLQDITCEDIMAEGIRYRMPGTTAQLYIGDLPQDKSLRTAFVRLWDSLNKKRGFGYATNPWVRIVEFEVLKS